MARFQAVQCDRCKYVSKPDDARYNQREIVPITVGERKLDLCGACKDKLDQFMSGRDLEVPP